jgi:hypothetical protein
VVLETATSFTSALPSRGGIKRLDAVLDHHLDEVLEALNDALWEAS